MKLQGVVVLMVALGSMALTGCKSADPVADLQPPPPAQNCPTPPDGAGAQVAQPAPAAPAPAADQASNPPDDQQQQPQQQQKKRRGKRGRRGQRGG